MVLIRVVYELFETDASTAEAAERGDPVNLDRQLRLEFSDSPPLFIAWTWGALPDSEYHVGWSHESFCKGAAELEHDASKTAVWAELVGNPLSLHYIGPDQQVLEVRAHEAAVFCCSFKQVWRADTLYLDRRLPEGGGDPTAS